MAIIKLSQGKEAIVDDELFEWLNQWKWTAMKHGRYAARRTQKDNIIRQIYMHRLIMNAPEGMEVDHIDNDGLNNQRLNLRLVTNKQNHYNHKIFSHNKSGYNGVSWNKKLGKWEVSISLNSKTVHGGLFTDIKDAARAANFLIEKHHGGVGRLNQIGGNS